MTTNTRYELHKRRSTTQHILQETRLIIYLLTKHLGTEKTESQPIGEQTFGLTITQ